MPIGNTSVHIGDVYRLPADGLNEAEEAAPDEALDRGVEAESTISQSSPDAAAAAAAAAALDAAASSFSLFVVFRCCNPVNRSTSMSSFRPVAKFSESSF